MANELRKGMQSKVEVKKKDYKNEGYKSTGRYIECKSCGYDYLRNKSLLCPKCGTLN